MEILEPILFIAAAAVSIYVVIKILAAPVRLAVKLLLNAVSGFLLLVAANFISGFFDFSIPINVVTCLVSGLLGIPGVLFLVVLFSF